MDSYAMYTVDSGDELTRGMQLPEHKARAAAQRTADRIGRAVELVVEGESDGEVFDPAAE